MALHFWQVDVDYFHQSKVQRLMELYSKEFPASSPSEAAAIYLELLFYGIREEDSPCIKVNKYLYEDIARTLSCKKDEVEFVVKTLLDFGELDKGLYKKQKILSSEKYQRVFEQIKSRWKTGLKKVPAEYSLLINSETDAHPRKSAEDCGNPRISAMYSNSNSICNSNVSISGEITPDVKTEIELSFFLENYEDWKRLAEEYINSRQSQGWKKASGAEIQDLNADLRCWIPRCKGKKKYSPEVWKYVKAIYGVLTDIGKRQLSFEIINLTVDDDIISLFCTDQVRQVLEDNIYQINVLAKDLKFKKLRYKIAKDDDKTDDKACEEVALPNIASLI